VALPFVWALARNAHTKVQLISIKAFMGNATRLYLLPEYLTLSQLL